MVIHCFCLSSYLQFLWRIKFRLEGSLGQGYLFQDLYPSNARCDYLFQSLVRFKYQKSFLISNGLNICNCFGFGFVYSSHLTYTSLFLFTSFPFPIFFNLRSIQNKGLQEPKKLPQPQSKTQKNFFRFPFNN